MKTHGIARGWALALVASSLAACASVADNRAPIVGDWKVLSYELEFQDTGERRAVFGKSPKGWIVLTRDGRAVSYLEAENRKAPKTDEDRAAAFRSLVAYTGKYRVEADRFITKVDGAWNVFWIGTEQARFFKVEGERLHITTQWGAAPVYDNRMVRGILVCERER